MNFDDVYALLLTHEARLEQNQNPQAMFNANYSIVNANYAHSSHMRGFPRRNNFFNASNGQYGGIGQYFGRGMFSTSYPRGFPAGNGANGGFGRGNAAVSFGRNQFQHFHRPPHIRNMFSPAQNQNISIGKHNELTPICQICHKQGHTADACWYRYGDNYLPKNFGRGKMIGSKAAYMANFESFPYQ